MGGFLACSVDEMTYCFLPREEKDPSHGSPGTAGSMALGGAHSASGTHGVCVDSGAPPWNTRLGQWTLALPGKEQVLVDMLSLLPHRALVTWPATEAGDAGSSGQASRPASQHWLPS